MEPTSYRSYTSLYRVSLSRDILQYFPGPIVFKKHLGVLKNSFITVRSRSNSLEKCWFLRRWENRSTVEPRFNEVPRDWGNLFVISRVRYIKRLNLPNFREKKTTKIFIIPRYSWQLIYKAQHSRIWTISAITLIILFFNTYVSVPSCI